MLIGVVGPCAAGKSTLVAQLQARDILAKNIAQEHSYVPKMWQILTNPDILIYLDVSFHKATQRRRLNWTEKEFSHQLNRLEHARNHADLIISTDGLNEKEVLDRVLNFIKKPEENN
jgi:deoxyadenosine/deoxycytidine kinase